MRKLVKRMETLDILVLLHAHYAGQKRNRYYLMILENKDRNANISIQYPPNYAYTLKYPFNSTVDLTYTFVRLRKNEEKNCIIPTNCGNFH